MKGTVKMFNKEKGYGFIRAEDGHDVFFHYSALLMDDYIEEESSPRGPRAKDIKKID